MKNYLITYSHKLSGPYWFTMKGTCTVKAQSISGAVNALEKQVWERVIVDYVYCEDPIKS